MSDSGITALSLPRNIRVYVINGWLCGSFHLDRLGPEAQAEILPLDSIFLVSLGPGIDPVLHASDLGRAVEIGMGFIFLLVVLEKCPTKFFRFICHDYSF